MIACYSISIGPYDGLKVIVDPNDNSLYIAEKSVIDVLCLPQDEVAQMKEQAESYTGRQFGKPMALMNADMTTVTVFYPMPLFMAFTTYQFTIGNQQAKALLLNGFSHSFQSMVMAQVA